MAMMLLIVANAGSMGGPWPGPGLIVSAPG
jgi:hypothetical protein